MDFREKIKAPFTLDPPTKLIIDIQGGLQDIFALYCANSIIQADSLNVNIIGITCTAGINKVEDAAKDALAANYLMKKKIPVFLGQRQSLLLRKDYPETYIKQIFSELEYILFKKSEHLHECIQKQKAIDFLIQSAKKYGPQLGIISFGPLTNLGLAQSLEQCFDDVKLISINGGQYTGVGTTKEGNIQPNFSYDPLAAHILFESPKLHNKIYVNPIEKTLKHDWKPTFKRCYRQCTLKEDKKNLLKILVQGGHQFMLWGSFLTILPIICPRFVKHYYHVYAEIVRDSEKIDGLMAINWLKVGSQPGEFSNKIYIYEDFDHEEIETLLLRVLDDQKEERV